MYSIIVSRYADTHLHSHLFIAPAHTATLTFTFPALVEHRSTLCTRTTNIPCIIDAETQPHPHPHPAAGRSPLKSSLFLAYIFSLPFREERIFLLLLRLAISHCAHPINPTKKNCSTQVMPPELTFWFHHHQQYYVASEHFGYIVQQLGGLFHESRVGLEEAAVNSASLGGPGSHPLVSI